MTLYSLSVAEMRLKYQLDIKFHLCNDKCFELKMLNADPSQHTITFEPMVDLATVRADLNCWVTLQHGSVLHHSNYFQLTYVADNVVPQTPRE